MKTKKQAELLASFLLGLDDEKRPVYEEIVGCLSAFGYHPHKERSNIIFKHDFHNKQMAKIGMRGNKDALPFVALRFSACRGYSQRFEDIVSKAIETYPSHAARCVNGGCDFCKGEPDSHVYLCIDSAGERKTHCGAYALEIPGISADDIQEIKALIKEEHRYLLKHEVGISESAQTNMEA